LKFTKMHGAGNDFLIVESSGEDRDWESLSIAMCERHYGVGADGVMLLLPSTRADIRMRLFNADGSEAEVSGNGVRCLVKYAVERRKAKPTQGLIKIEAVHDVLEAHVATDGQRVTSVRLSRGEPRFDPAEVPVVTDQPAPVTDLPLPVDGREVRVTCVSMGNPHAVTFTSEAIADYPLDVLGPLVEHHEIFPNRVNFGVARVIDQSRMDVRVWERGAGETLACGSGCCAAMVAAHLKGRVGDSVDITQPGGLLTVDWAGTGDVFLRGPAAFIFDGDWPA
jgi:diaminopimelate epimerase